MGSKKAFITGITGQDGSYLAEFLVEKGYEVHGMVRRSSSFNRGNIEHLTNRADNPSQDVTLHYGDLTDPQNIDNLISTIQPHEIYNLAAQSHVAVSFKTAEYTSHVNALGPLRVLHSIVSNNLHKTCRFYQASTSEMFGKVQETPQTEKTPFYPRSPYGVSKLFAYWTTINYREAFDLFACNGICFNHESPRRGENFVTRKITLSISSILAGKQDKLRLGNLDSFRDWGYARDFVKGMWATLQNDTPEDYVFATGQQHSVRDFVQVAFGFCGFDIKWRGSGTNEVGFDSASGQVLVVIDPSYYRPTEVDTLIGCFDKAKTQLNWQPETSFKELVYLMVYSDLQGNNLDPNKYLKPFESNI